MKTAYRTSISISPQLGEKLQQYKNKSSIIEQSLELFFQRDIVLKKAEKKYLKSLNSNKKELIVKKLAGIAEGIKVSEEDYKKHLIKKYL